MTSEDRGNIQIAGILGSVRPGNYTAKTLALVADEIRRRDHFRFDIIDPAKLTLAPPGLGGGSEDAKALRATIQDATGVE